MFVRLYGTRDHDEVPESSLGDDDVHHCRGVKKHLVEDIRGREEVRWSLACATSDELANASLHVSTSCKCRVMFVRFIHSRARPTLKSAVHPVSKLRSIGRHSSSFCP